MAGADKRAKLLSDLLATKGAATGAGERAPEPEHGSVIQIAKRRMSEERASEPPPAPAPSVLYSKGAATASTFRPSYWSFDHEQQAEAKAPPETPEPPAAPVPSPPAALPPTSRPLPINFVVAFGCVALFLSTTLFVLSQWHRSEPIDAAPAVVAALPAATPAAPVSSATTEPATPTP